MVAVIYARYSDSKQTEESIEGQLKVCNEYCQKNNYIVLREYIDRAQSGRTDNRIQFRKMINDSKNKQFDAVIVYSFDRFGRNMLESLTNEDLLHNNDIELISATEQTQHSPSGTMHRNVLMSFAQYYSDELAQKVNRGLIIKC